METFPGHFVQPRRHSQYTLRGSNANNHASSSMNVKFDDRFIEKSEKFPISHNDEIKITHERIWPRRKRLHQSNAEQSNQSKNLIALASFPGSGNTWLRYLLQQATGKHAFFIYCKIVRRFFLFTWDTPKRHNFQWIE